MGLSDKINELREKAADIDTSESHEYGHGFDSDVCEGCEHRKGGTPATCGICGCPLTNLSVTSSPPSKCPKLDEHEEK